MTKTQLLATAIAEMVSMRDSTDNVASDILDMILALCNEVKDD